MDIPRAAENPPKKIVKFEIRSFNQEKELLVYHIVYDVDDWSGTDDEDGEINKDPPFLNCKYKDADLGVKTTSEWGILDLKNKKVVEAVTVRRLARSKKDCTSEKQAQRVWKSFEERIKNLGLKLTDSISLLQQESLSDDLKAETLRGAKALAVYQALDTVSRKSLPKMFCYGGDLDIYNFDDPKDVERFHTDPASFQDNSMSLITLNIKNKNIWLEGFCPRHGAIAPSYDFSFKGFLGDQNGFYVFINFIEESGAGEGLNEQKILVTSKLKLQ